MSVIWSGITEQGAVVPVQVDESGKVIARSDVAGDYVKKSGDTMTGPLVLPGNPTQDLQAATKGYVDLMNASEELLAFGTFSVGTGVFNSKNIQTVRSKGDGLYEFYFTNIPNSAKYATVLSSNSSTVVVVPKATNALYFAVQGFLLSTGDPADQYGMCFSCFQVPVDNFISIS